jgi:hypothetical protein
VVVRRTLAGIVALLAFALPAAAGAQQIEIGAADQNPGIVEDAYFRWVGVANARVMAPYDVALTDPAPLDRWLRAARRAGVRPLVSFQHRDGEDCRKVACHLPTPEEYGQAIAAFHARWPDVTRISTFNEGNHPSQPTAGDPAAAARLYEAAVANCAGCEVLAAEVVDSPNMISWLEGFLAALPAPPTLWGLHNYADVTRGETGRTERMLSTVPGRVLLTETGGIVSWVDDDGVLRWPYDEERARAAVDLALTYAETHSDRIGAVYLYRWRAEPWERWDSGLLRPDSTPRPSFEEVVERLKPTGPRPYSVPATTSPAGEVQAGAGPAPRQAFGAPRAVARLVRGPQVRRRRVVEIRVACPATAPAACRVRLAARGLAVTARVAPGAARTLRIARARAMTARRVRVRITLGRGAVVHAAVPTAPRHR